MSIDKDFLTELLDKITIQIIELEKKGLRPGCLILGKKPFRAAIFEIRKLRSLDLKNHPISPDESHLFDGLHIVLDKNSEDRISVTAAASFRTELALRDGRYN